MRKESVVPRDAGRTDNYKGGNGSVRTEGEVRGGGTLKIPHLMLLTTPLQENNCGSPGSVVLKLTVRQDPLEGLFKPSLWGCPQSFWFTRSQVMVVLLRNPPLEPQL